MCDQHSHSARQRHFVVVMVVDDIAASDVLPWCDALLRVRGCSGYVEVQQRGVSITYNCLTSVIVFSVLGRSSVLLWV